MTLLSPTPSLSPHPGLALGLFSDGVIVPNVRLYQVTRNPVFVGGGIYINVLVENELTGNFVTPDTLTCVVIKPDGTTVTVPAQAPSAFYVDTGAPGFWRFDVTARAGDFDDTAEHSVRAYA
jgi:hypothetical protein